MKAFSTSHPTASAVGATARGRGVTATMRWLSGLFPSWRGRRARRWVTLHLPLAVAAQVGPSDPHRGVPLETSIAAALWVFSTLSVGEKASIIREYLERAGDLARAQGPGSSHYGGQLGPDGQGPFVARWPSVGSAR
jgi:hypothetical protein